MHVMSATRPILTNISFGYASSAQPLVETSRRNTNFSEENESSLSEERPSTSEEPESEITCPEDPGGGEFFARMPDRRVVPLFCQCLSGREADVFLEVLSEKNMDRLKKFLEREDPDVGEYHIWVRNDDNGQVTVVSVKALENHLRSERVKRVKWRHVSLDKVSIYRYSVPVITTKFRLRLVHFLSRNYRCCILCVWCFVIFFISIGIVLTVIFGSTPMGRFGRNQTSNETLNDTRLLNAAKNGGMPAHG